MTMTKNSEVLNSWKEVATYLGRGVRTVQRWEQELGLPVRRPRGKTRSAVIAFRNELDQWLQHTPTEIAIDDHHPSSEAHHAAADGLSERVIQLHGNTAQLTARTQELVNRSTELCERMKKIKDKVNHAVELTTIQIERNAKKNQVVFVKSSPPAKRSHQQRILLWPVNHPEANWQIRHPRELATAGSSS